MDQAVTGYQRIERLVDVLAERLLAAPERPVIPARGEYASQRPPEQRTPRLRHTYTYGAFGAASAVFDVDIHLPGCHGSPGDRPDRPGR